MPAEVVLAVLEAFGGVLDPEKFLVFAGVPISFI
jgi:hypothetical protein